MRSCVSCGVPNPDHARFCLACGAAIETIAHLDSRRLVTVLFCDLADSTALGTRIDPESLRKVIARYYDEMRRAIERHGGTVEKFIGDAVMAVFGIPQLHEDDAVRAVRAAVEMRQTLDGLNDELEHERGVTLVARIGVNSGEVVAGDSSSGHPFVTGEPVNLAARLEQAAEPGGILLGPATHRLVRDAVETVPVGPLQLKGFERPVTAYRLTRVIPGAPGHSRRFDSPLVDREREMALLRDAFERTGASRQCQLFTILGSAGVGKSRLAEEFLTWSGDRCVPFRGRCLAYGEGITFWPIVEMVTGAAGIDTHDAEDVAIGKISSLIAGQERSDVVAHRVAQAIGSAGGAGAPEETFWAIRTLFSALASRRGTIVLLFDDIHWAEPTLLGLIDHLSEWTKDVPLMLLCLARPELLELSPTWSGGRMNATTVLLEPLSDDDGSALAGNLLGSADVAPDVLERVVEAAGGNPFFLEEILSMLIEDRVLVRVDDRWTSTADLSRVELPPTISALLAARLDRLEPKERMVMERASVVGSEFSTASLEVLIDGPAGDVAPTLSALVRKELVRPDGADGFRFRHILIRDAAYASLPKETRASLHERFADWLESRTPPRAEGLDELIGYHLEQSHRYLAQLGPLGQDGQALAARAGARLASAGKRAIARGDAPAASSLLTRAAALLAIGDPVRIEVMIGLADSRFHAGDIQGSEAALVDLETTATAQGDAAALARARFERRLRAFLIDPGTVALTELRAFGEEATRAFEEARDIGGLARTFEQLGTVHWITGEATAMLEAAERALSLAVEAGDRSVLPGAVAYIGHALTLGPTSCAGALERLTSLEADVRDDPMLRANAQQGMAVLLAMLRRFDESRELAAAVFSTFEELGQRRWLAGASSTLGFIARTQGLLEEAEREFRSGYAFFRAQGDMLNAVPAACELAQVLCDLDRPEEADRLTAQTGRIGEVDIEARSAWRRVRARVLARRGALDEAMALAHDAVAILDRTEFVDFQAEARLDLTEVLSAAGRRDEAAEAVDAAVTRFTDKGDRAGLARAIERRELLV